MSVVMAVKVKNKVAVSADSLATEGDRVWSSPVTKILRAGPFIIGSIGDLRVSQHFMFECATMTKVTLNKLAETLNLTMGASGCDPEDVETLAVDPVEGTIWVLDLESHPFEIKADYHAIGSGDVASIAAYHALTEYQPNWDAISLSKACVKATCAIILSCAPPIVTLS